MTVDFFFNSRMHLIAHAVLNTEAVQTLTVALLLLSHRTDGSFAVHDIPSGSYVVEVVSPSYRFEPARVDITSKGKMRSHWLFFDRPYLFTVLLWSCTHTSCCLLHCRARLVNYIKTSEVVRQPYPLQIRAAGAHSYFMKRETWGWTDFLMNPMVNV